MEKRLIIAIALSLFIIITFQFFTPKPPLSKDKIVKELPQAAPQEGPQAIFKVSDEGAALSEDEERVENDKYIITFSNAGGSIKDIRLKNFKTVGSDEPFALLNLRNPKEYIGAIWSSKTSKSLDSILYNFSKKDGIVTYSAKVENFEITKQYILHKDNYAIELRVFIKNISGETKDFNYNIIGCSGLTEASAQDKRFIEVSTMLNGKIEGFKRPKSGEKITSPGIISWVALKNRYFSVVLKPIAAATSRFYSESKTGYYVAGATISDKSIPANAAIEEKFLIYAGPSQISELKKVDQEFELTINYGFFGGIAKALLAIMRLFYNIVRSWGFAIILLAIFLNIILFPLSIKSFKSMQKMQELHPQMEKLKAQYKNDAQKLNKEIMELYKENKINPLSGCLPLLLQMPIFIALYQALSKSIELRCASFFWIKDLSMPDALKIPFSMPLLGSSINVLPLAMVIAMVVQQKMSTKTMGSAVTEEQKQQQKMMLIIMPIMFGFIFYSMPSGLVLYWLVNTVLTVLEQSVIFKKQ